ncbi:MAG TPA: hypothetical protein VIX19_11635 [Terriglobales bacterium]
MTQPQAIVSARGKSVITLRIALISTIRTWFLYRDEALWAFVGGTESERPLEEIVIGDEAMTAITEANAACRRAWAMAEKIAKETEQKTSTVMREAIVELSASETPAFPLSVPHIPGSF